MRPPRVSVITFTSYICCIYALKFGQYWTLFCVGNSSVSKRLVYSFCSSDRGFASDFLQTPPHDGRPCLWLTVPTAKPVADFHRQVITRAEHTTKRPIQRTIPTGGIVLCIGLEFSFILRFTRLLILSIRSIFK